MTALTRSVRRKLKRSGSADPAAGTQIEAMPAAPIGATRSLHRSTSRRTTRCSPTSRAPAAPSTSTRSSSTRPRSRELHAAGVKLAVPLVSQGELIGVLNLGPRLSEQDYSTDDRKLLDNLAAQAAPALRVGQLVREQEAEAATRERFEQELEVAQLIQQNFLPQASCPTCPAGRSPPTTARRARSAATSTTSSRCPTARSAFVVGDVTDKGVPAALVMAATRSVLRASAQRLVEPGDVLERVNEHLCPDMPEKMFVTCLYGVLDPRSGPLPLRQRRPRPAVRQDRRRRRSSCAPAACRSGSCRAWPTRRRRPCSQPGDSRAAALRRHRRGARRRTREMFGFPRLKETVGRGRGRPGADRPRARRPRRLHRPRRRAGGRHHDGHPPALAGAAHMVRRVRGSVLAEFELPSEPGNERVAIERVERARRGARPRTERRLERLKTAVARGDDERDGARQRVPRATGRSSIRVLTRPTACACRSPTSASAGELAEPEDADLEAKLAGLQQPARLGPVPDREHGRRDARDERRGAPHPRARACAWKETTMATSELQRRCAERDGVAVIDLAGDVELAAPRRRSRRPGTQATAERADAVVLNFERAGYINSTGIALIVGLLAQARAAGIEVRALRADATHYREIFEITRLADFMAINPDEDSAVSGAEGSTDA